MRGFVGERIFIHKLFSERDIIAIKVFKIKETFTEREQWDVNATRLWTSL